MSQAGKGDRDRTTDKKAYDAGIDRIDWDKKKLTGDPEKCYKLGKAHYPQTEQKLKEN